MAKLDEHPDIKPPGPAEVWPIDASAHKLYAPPVYPGAIRRDAILARIVGDKNLRVILLQGPAGHGKSTTLQQLKTEYQAQAWLTSWLTLDDADNDPRRFALHIRAVIDSVCSAGAADGAAGRTDRPGRAVRRADWALDRLSRAGKPVAIFLDEFQAIRNPLLTGFFRDLFDRVPENVRIFVGSRSLPELGLAKLLVNNIALVLRADDLRFSPGEVASFFSGFRELRISPDEIGAIYRRTEGWPAALQLYRLTLASPEVRSSLGDLGSDSPRELAEYLADNVLTLQPLQIQDFLLRTSLLNRLNADLCNAVTGRHDSQQVLLDLERSGLFVRSLDAEGRWFKYHGLFSTILAESLRKISEQTACRVHQVAARWHLAHLLHEEVLNHALACRDFDLAADTLNVWASQLVASGQLVTVERWFGQLPLERILERPSLVIKAAYALMFLRRESRLRPLMEFLRRHATVGHVEHTTDPRVALSMAAVLEDNLSAAVEIAESLCLDAPKARDFAAFEIAAASNLLSYRDLAVGDFEAARKRLALAQMCNDRGQAAFSGGYTRAMAGMCRVFQGFLPEAIDRLHRQISDASAHMDGSLASAASASCYLWALYEANELDAVEATYTRYHDNIAESVIPDFIAFAHLAMARTFDARGRPDKALEVLEEFERIGHDSGWPRLIAIADWERVRRALIAGDPDRACAIAAHAATARYIFPGSWISLSEDLEGETLGRIRLGVHTLDGPAAGKRIAHELRRQPHRVYRQIKLYLMEALLKRREGMHNAAHRSLRQAMLLARPGRYIRCFIDEGQGVVELLREVYQRMFRGSSGEDASSDVGKAFIEELLAASGLDLNRDPASRQKPAARPLSDREKEMLVYIAGGISNRDMARRLLVSENTIKFHLKNVYSKLGVANRLQAINAARQAGLLPME